MQEIGLFGVAFGLLAFGTAYAYRIAVKPFPAHLTWLSVAVGDAVTDAGMSIALWLLTGDWRICLVPWAAHALTGLPMIVGQAVKAKLQDDGAEATDSLLRNLSKFRPCGEEEREEEVQGDDKA